MPSIERLLDQRVQQAIRAAFPDAADAPAIVQPSQDARFGDYQANGAMGLAKRLKKKPREVAEAIVARLDLRDIAEKPEIAGPGFINLRLRPDWVSAELGRTNPGDRLGVEPAARPETVVVDYSAPNIAKKMHVGHLRSTIIGDAIARLLDHVNQTVIRQNHIGDWGTNFGAVVLSIWHLFMAQKRGDGQFVERTLGELSSLKKDDPTRENALKPIRDLHQSDLGKDWRGASKDGFKDYLERLKDTKETTIDHLEVAYQFVNLVESLAAGTSLTMKCPPDGREVHYSRIASYVTSMLQNKVEGSQPEQELAGWAYAKELTFGECNAVYQQLGVLLHDSDVRPESFYNPMLDDVIAELHARGMLCESNGAQCVFLKSPDGKPLFVNKEGEPLPLIVQKSDEAFPYAATDLAAIRYRCGTGPEKPPWGRADRILYVVDARQALHFQMVFAVARMAGFAPEHVQLVHVAFGTMMGPDGKPFKTRAGGTVKLMKLLDEAEEKAYRLVSEKSPDVLEEERRHIAHIVGIGAVKYADLSQNRTSDYVFSWEKMLSLDGNTAPYMQYAYARVRSIFRKGGHEAEDHRADPSPVALGTPQELALAKAILRFPETLDRALNDYRPNVLAAYLYDLAGAFTAFYDACPVIQSAEPLRSQRLKLCDLTARVIAKGLGLLGIETAERM